MNNKKRSWLEYLFDLWCGATKYSNGWLKPWAVIGYFPDTTHGSLQKKFFEILLANGFRRTCWQIVFPGQIAGIVKKISADLNQANEYHVRFYSDGTIDCELEVSRFQMEHWVGPRSHEFSELERILARENEMSGLMKLEIKSLFNIKEYSKLLARKR